MNEMYRSIYNESLGAWVAVPEFTLAKGKKNSTKTGSGLKTQFRFAVTTLAAGIALALSGQAMAAPLVVNLTGNVANENCSYLIDGMTGTDCNALPAGLNTVTIGNESQALGDGGITIGKTHYYSVNSGETGAGSNYDNDGATASGAIAAGPKAAASGANSIALGNDAKSTGRESIAIGHNAKTADIQNVTIGTGSSVDGRYSLALGHEAKASTADGRATAVGGGATASEQFATALGTFSTASAHGATAVGPLSSASGHFSTALGYRSKATAADLKTGEKTAFSGIEVNEGGIGVISVGTSEPMYPTGPIATRRIINVQGGINDTDAVNVLQLRTAGNNLADALGGGANFSDTDNTWTAPTYTITKTDGTTYPDVTNVADALSNLNAEVVKPLGFSGDSGTDVSRKLGETVSLTGGITDSSLHALFTPHRMVKSNK